MERRLTTIVAADIAGFSRLIGADEEGTLTAQRAHRAELIDPLLEKHGGRVANTAGDSLLIEFPSAVEAVRCAVAVQEGMAARNADVAPDRRIEFRVGINIGDVVDQDGDLLGDGVNIAARLEALAPPGGIFVSRTVRDQVRDREAIGLADLGEVEVKNIARPVRAFQVVREGEAPVQAPAPLRRRPSLVGALVAMVIAAGLVGYWVWQQPDFEPANAANFAYPLPDKPSIAVLAFDNLSGDPSQEYISDGFSGDITSALARIPELFVIARNSAFSYKGKPTKVQTIAEELGVRHVLEGSIQKSGDGLRVTAQLIDAVNGRHLWARSFDREFGDLFSVRDEIVLEVAKELNMRLVRGSTYWGENQTDNLEAWLLAMEAWSIYEQRTDESLPRAMELNRRALELHPDSATLLEAMGWRHLTASRQSIGDPETQLSTAEAFAKKAITVDSSYGGSYALMSRVHTLRGDFTAALEDAEKAVAASPGDSNIHALLAVARLKAGEPDDAVESFNTAIRLNPLAPGWVFENLGEAYRLVGRHSEAIDVYRVALTRGVSGWLAAETHLGLALSYSATGNADLAYAAIASAREAFPKFTASFARRFWAYKDPNLGPSIADELIRLGLPEE